MQKCYASHERNAAQNFFELFILRKLHFKVVLTQF